MPTPKPKPRPTGPAALSQKQREDARMAAKPTTKPKITAAEKGIAKELSPKGMKATAKKQSDAMDKKYPGLYKNGKK
jgi:hypothetical protein